MTEHKHTPVARRSPAGGWKAECLDPKCPVIAEQTHANYHTDATEALEDSESMHHLAEHGPTDSMLPDWVRKD